MTMDMTRRVMTNTKTPHDNKAPMGQFYRAKTSPDASFHDVTIPNADTLYSIAWLNLSEQPYLLNVPNSGSRYYLMPMLDAWTNVFSDPGTRTTGDGAKEFAITGPNWTGSLPIGVSELKSSTNMVWIIGRTYCTGTPEDYKAVYKIQDQYTLKPLSYYGKEYTPPEGHIDNSIDTKTPVRDQVNSLSIEEYFTRLAILMKENPPAKADAGTLQKMAKIGFVPGDEFSLQKLDSSSTKALIDVPQAALETIFAHSKDAGKNINGWLFTLDTGNYGTDYLQRAYITAIGLGANKPEDALYPTASTDSDGKPLDGANKYVIHFTKAPPVKAFWSLTMYNDKFFFIANPLNRYTLSPRNTLNYHKDGSFDLFIQHDQPDQNKIANWLPAPKGPFNLMLRFYWHGSNLVNSG